MALFVTKQQDEPYPTSMDDYVILGRIGKGAFASVFVANCVSKNEKVAIKVIELELTAQQKNEDENKSNNKAQNDADNDGDISWDEIQKEAAIMTRMNHRNIVCCHASFSVVKELWLVMPLLIGSCLDIMKSIAEYHHGFVDEVMISTMISDVLKGIQYIHNDGRVHRDIKSANILLSQTGICQISDFGVSGAMIESGIRKNGRDTFTGSLWWMSPEVLQRENKHSYSTDIWSIGITALELAFGKPPHSKQRPVKVMLTILQSPPPTLDLCIQENTQSNINYKYSKKFGNFLAKCLQKDPNKRSSASTLLNHSFMKQSKDNQYLYDKIISRHDLNHRNINNNKTNLNNHILPHSVSQKQKKKAVAMDNTRIESNGFDFNSEINSISHSHSLSQQKEHKQSEKLGRFDVIVQNKQTQPNPDNNETNEDSADATTKKGRFRITNCKQSENQ